jgi:predicted RNase H-like nuclease
MRTHAIIPKNPEVDRVITPELQQRVRQRGAHPDVGFRLINGSPLLHPKKKRPAARSG